MAVKVTMQGGEVATIEGAPEDAAAFVRALHAAAHPAAPQRGVIPPSVSKNDIASSSPDGPEPPAVEKMAAYIDGLPGKRHTMTNLTMNFAGQTIPSRAPDGNQSSLYRKWLDRADAARRVVAEKNGGVWDVEKDGTKKTYYLRSK